MTNPTEKIKEEMENILDEQFPKGKCKERGNALVLYAEFIIKLKKREAEILEIIDNMSFSSDKRENIDAHNELIEKIKGERI